MQQKVKHHFKHNMERTDYRIAPYLMAMFQLHALGQCGVE